MGTMTLTEFNQNPSRATSLARVEDLIVTDRGKPSFVLKAVAKPESRIDALRRAGLIRPARRTPATEPFPSIELPDGLARSIIAEFEASKDDRGY